MQLVDSHSHLDLLDLAEYQGNLAKAVAYAESQGVSHFLCPCVTLKDFPRMLEVIKPFQNVYAAVGLHPNETTDLEPDADMLAAMAQSPRVIAIGETGLDYYRTTGDHAAQQQRFREHIRASRETRKPLIVHSRQAREDTIRILSEENASLTKGVMHCFTENLEMARAAMALGFYISFSGIVTFSNAKELQEVAREIPLESMLIETDAPWLAPVPFRGKTNQPAYVRHVAEFIAGLRGVTLEDIAMHTTRNFFKLFKLDT